MDIGKGIGRATVLFAVLLPCFPFEGVLSVLALGYSDRNELLSCGCLWLDGTVYWHLTGRLLVNCEEYGLYVVCLSLTSNGTEKCGEH